MFQEHDIYKYIKAHGGKASVKDIIKTFGVDSESKRVVEEKLGNMIRFKLIVLDDDTVSIP